MGNSIFRNPEEMFTEIPIDEVTLYLRRYVTESKSADRRKEIKKRLNELDSSRVKAILAFKNEYGEKYLVVKESNGDIHWCADESDWEYATSFYEDKYIRMRLKI